MTLGLSVSCGLRALCKSIAMRKGVMRGGVLALLGLSGLLGCASQPAAQVTPEALRAAIRSGELIQPADRVRVVTTSDGERELVVVALDADHIRARPVRGERGHGEGEVTVPIDEVIRIEKVVFEKRAAKYVVPAAGLYVGAGLLAIIIFGFL